MIVNKDFKKVREVEKKETKLGNLSPDQFLRVMERVQRLIKEKDIKPSKCSFCDNYTLVRAVSSVSIKEKRYCEQHFNELYEQEKELQKN